MVLSLLSITPELLKAHPALLQRLSHVHLTSFLTNNVYAAIYPHGYSDALVMASNERHRKAICEDSTSRYLAVINCPSIREWDGAAAWLHEDDDDDDQDHRNYVTAEEWANRALYLGEGCERLIAFGKAQIFETPEAEASRKDTSERVWPEGTNVALVNEFWGQIQQVRAKWGKMLGAHLQLDLLATSPEWMGKGAGSMIVKRVAAECDQRSIPGFLEGSPEGLKAYQRGGWIDTGDRVKVDLGRYEGCKDNRLDWREMERVKEGEEGKCRGWYENIVMVRPAMGKSIEDYLDRR